MILCSRSPRPSRVPASLQKAQADPHGLLPLAAAQAGAGLREQPVRGGPGEEGTRQDTALVRDPGDNDRQTDSHSLYLFSVCLRASLNHLPIVPGLTFAWLWP